MTRKPATVPVEWVCPQCGRRLTTNHIWARELNAPDPMCGQRHMIRVMVRVEEGSSTP